MSTDPWQTAEIPGPTRARTLNRAEVAISVIKQAVRPILVVGHLAAQGESEEKERPIDYLIKLAKATSMPVVATAHTIVEFEKRGFATAYSMPAVDIANRLNDISWSGLDGKGPYDLAILVGLPYYMEWLLFSGLKHFSKDLKLVSLDRFYQPHATWSFPNLNYDKWKENISEIIDKYSAP